MRAPLSVILAGSVAAMCFAGCNVAPATAQRPPEAERSQAGDTLPPPYEGPLSGKERVAWVQAVGAGTRIAEFTFVVYVDGKKLPLPGAACELLQGSRHHVCQAPLPELAPGKHTLGFAAVRVIDGKEHVSRLSAPLTVTRSPEGGAP